MNHLRLMVLELILPIVELMGRIHMPYSRKAITGVDVFSITPFLKPGAVLLSYSAGEMTNLLIDGRFKHAAICGETFLLDHTGTTRAFHCTYVIEAKTSGVVMTDIVSFMTSKDAVLLLYPRFCDASVMEKASIIAHKYIGAPYDYLFQPGSDAFYCSELIAEAYEEAMGTRVFEKRSRLGVETIVPDDYYKASQQWQVIWDSTGKKPGDTIGDNQRI